MAKRDFGGRIPACSQKAQRTELYAWREEEMVPSAGSFLAASSRALGGVCTPELDLLALPRRALTQALIATVFPSVNFKITVLLNNSKYGYLSFSDRFCQDLK